MGITKSWMLENELSVKRKCCSVEGMSEKVWKHPGKLDWAKEISFIPHNEQVTLTDTFSPTSCINVQKMVAQIQWNA